MYKFIEQFDNKIRIKIYVKPASTTEKLILEGEELVFYTKEPPIQGRANASLIKFFSKKLKISSSKIRIIYGYRKKLKILEITSEKTEELINKVIENLNQ